METVVGTEWRVCDFIFTSIHEAYINFWIHIYLNKVNFNKQNIATCQFCKSSLHLSYYIINNAYCTLPANEVMLEPALPEETTAETTIDCGDTNYWLTDDMDAGELRH